MYRNRYNVDSTLMLTIASHVGMDILLHIGKYLPVLNISFLIVTIASTTMTHVLVYPPADPWPSSTYHLRPRLSS